MSSKTLLILAAVASIPVLAGLAATTSAEEGAAEVGGAARRG